MKPPAGGGGELEKFLQEVARKLADAQQQQQRPAPPQQRQPAPPANRRPAQPPQIQPPPPRRPTRSAQPIEAEIVETPTQSLTDRIAQREQAFAERVKKSTSTEDVQSHLDEHIHKAFDHNVGSIAAAAEDPNLYSDDVTRVQRVQGLDPYNLLAPRNIIDAVLLREIMQRPEERWAADDRWDHER